MRMARAEDARIGPIRCAIYTRKSTEEGLEQSFNSLDAQREACEAYVISQRHEGWTLTPERYDDGGFSGGTLDRPGLRQLLADVKTGKVDVIIVYKVDRLTRSLADFAKIVEILDAAKASFVSVTQSFNTTSSMGRLTLNVLLSFAQFEREVTGERIRDKVAQSKARGLWMGGNIPLGYVVEDRKLKLAEAEAEKVRTIYRRYLELGSVSALADALDDAGIISQIRTSNAGRALGGKTFTKGALYHILKNRIYVGEVSHKGKAFPGEHDGIIDPAVFAQVQALLDRNAVSRRLGQHRDAPAALAYLVWDGLGRRMSPNHAQKGDARYRYYASRRDGRDDRRASAWRVPAVDLEEIVIGAIRHHLRDHEALRNAVATATIDPIMLQLMFDRAALLAEALGTDDAIRKRGILAKMVDRVTVYEDEVVIAIWLDDAVAPSDTEVRTRRSAATRLSIKISIVRTGKRTTLAIAPAQSIKNQRQDASLIKLIAKAYGARTAVEASTADPKELARSMGHDKDYFARLVRLGYLAPDIVTAIIDGRQPATLTRQRLARVSKLPFDWTAQRALLGFACA
jgi:site-specific DNA recombinase